MPNLPARGGLITIYLLNPLMFYVEVAQLL